MAIGRQSPLVKRLETRLSRLLDRPVTVPLANQAFDSRHYDNRNPFFNQPGQQAFMPFIAVAGAGRGLIRQTISDFATTLVTRSTSRRTSVRSLS